MSEEPEATAPEGEEATSFAFPQTIAELLRQGWVHETSFHDRRLVSPEGTTTDEAIRVARRTGLDVWNRARTSVVRMPRADGPGPGVALLPRGSLARCPWCKGPAELFSLDSGTRHHGACATAMGADCDAAGPWRPTPEEAAEAWNELCANQIDVPKLRRRVAQLEAALGRRDDEVRRLEARR